MFASRFSPKSILLGLIKHLVKLFFIVKMLLSMAGILLMGLCPCMKFYMKQILKINRRLLFLIHSVKSYGKVSLNFYLNIWNLVPLISTWCGWMKQSVVGGTLCVKINSILGTNFRTHKSVRQGDPIYPLLFNMINDLVAMMMFRKFR
jgi:hypothetical protein